MAFDLNTEVENRISSDENIQNQIDVIESGYLGSIKPTDAAPTPARNGWYDFSSAGTFPSWLTPTIPATPNVAIGDRASVVFLNPGYSYTHISQSDKQTKTDAALQNIEIASIRTDLNNKSIEILPLAVTPETLSQSTKDLINAGGNGVITNLADDEDLTSTGGVIKFKNKAYLPANNSGLGKVFLRKNIVGGINILTQSVVNNENTIYIIQYDYDLNGATIDLPANCILVIDGGHLSNGTINFNSGVFSSTDKTDIFENIIIKNLRHGFRFNLDLYKGLLAATDSIRIESGSLIKSLISNNKNITILLDHHSYYFDETVLNNTNDEINSFKIIGVKTGIFGSDQYSGTIIKPFRIGQHFILKLGGDSIFTGHTSSTYPSICCSSFSIIGLCFNDSYSWATEFKLVNYDASGVTKKYGMLCLDNAVSGTIDVSFSGQSPSLYIRESWEISIPNFKCYGSYTKDSVIYFDRVTGLNPGANCSAIFFDLIAAEAIRGSLVEVSPNCKLINSGANTISCERGTSRVLSALESFSADYDELVSNLRIYKLNPLLKLYGGEFTINELNQNTTDIGVFTDENSVKWIDSTIEIDGPYSFSIGTIIDTYYFLIVSSLNSIISKDAHLMIDKVVLKTTDDYLSTNTTGQSNAGIYIKSGTTFEQYIHTYIGNRNVPINPDLIIPLNLTSSYSAKGLIDFFNKSKERGLSNYQYNGIMYEVFTGQNKSTDIDGVPLTRKFISSDLNGALLFKLVSLNGAGKLRTDYYKNGALLFSDVINVISNGDPYSFFLSLRRSAYGSYDYAQIYVDTVSAVTLEIISCSYMTSISHLAPSKDTVIDADELPINDSANGFGIMRTTFLNLWNNYIKPKANLLYQPLFGNVVVKTVSQNIHSNGVSVYKKGNPSDINGSVVASSELGSVKFYGYDGVSDSLSAYIISAATENWSPTAHGNQLTIATTANGTITPAPVIIFGQDRSASFLGKLNLNTLTASQSLELDASKNIISVPKGTFSVATKEVVAEYASNAAAITAGLVAGTHYRTGEVLKIVY